MYEHKICTRVSCCIPMRLAVSCCVPKLAAGQASNPALLQVSSTGLCLNASVNMRGTDVKCFYLNPALSPVQTEEPLLSIVPILVSLSRELSAEQPGINMSEAENECGEHTE